MATTVPEPVYSHTEVPEHTALLPHARGLLRFSTAGSVDDGKSTLIGRLLFDSRAVYEDQLASVRKSKVNRSSGPIDFSLLTDGLRAEREQGITIDVAYRYFVTPRRKFIIADTPGHEQYTRNMATGASTADAAIVLIDATKGLLPQSRRHAYIASLLGVRHIVAAINKMDLADYSREVFERIAADFHTFVHQLGVTGAYAIPVSALEGDNVVRRSPRMPWFDSPSLLEYLEELPTQESESGGPLRFPVQYVVRPDANFRGFAGRIASGTLRPGDSVVALPSGVKTRVKSVVAYHGDLRHASAGDSVNITLEDEIDLSRGDLLSSVGEAPHAGNNFAAQLVWMHADRLDPHKHYILKHTTRSVRARVRQVRHRVDINTLAHAPAAHLELNEIGAVDVHTSLPLFFDPYSRNRTTGSFILIDPISNATVAAGIIGGPVAPARAAFSPVDAIDSRVVADDRASRFGHFAAAVWVSRPRIAEWIERALFDDGWLAQHVATEHFSALELAAVARALHRSGAVAIFSSELGSDSDELALRSIFGPQAFFSAAEDASRELSTEDDQAIAARLLDALREWRDASSDSLWKENS
ncbi:MAG: sulfate adenylyltransferase subunit CysN [Candidatus Acidiferrales bacterium]